MVASSTIKGYSKVYVTAQLIWSGIAGWGQTELNELVAYLTRI